MVLPPNLLIILLTTLVLSANNNQTFSQYREQMEGYVKLLATNLQENYAFDSCRCSGNAFFDQCVGIDTPKCYPEFPRHLDCLGPGVKMSQSITFRMSEENKKNSLNCQEGSFMCGVDEKLQATFQEISNNRRYRFAKTFLGAPTGVFVSHPGSLSHCDTFYDPRLRPWYVGGSTGSRNILMLFKIKSKKTRAIQIADYLVNTTKLNDQVLIVDLNNCNGEGFCNTPARATKYHQNLAYQYLKGIKTSGSNWNSNFMIERAKNLFQNAETKNKNVIVVVTDDVPTDSSLQDVIQSPEINAYNPILFPIIIGNVDSSLQDLSSVACNSKGILIHDSNTNKYYVEVMNDYTRYFTEELHANKPLWSPIYLDAFGFGLMVTVVMPAYTYNQTSQKTTLIGVAGLDVTLEYLQQTFGLSQSQIQAQFISFLDYKDTNVLCNCSLCSNEQRQDIISQSASIKWQQGEQFFEVCCDITVNAFIGVMVSIGVLIIVVVVVIVCCRRGEPPNKGEGYLFNHPKANPSLQKF